MPRKQPIQQSFASGQVSDRFSAQVKSEVYLTGVEEANNFMSLSQGPMQRRPELEHWGIVPGAYGRVFGLPISAGAGFFVVVSGDGYIYIVTEAGTRTDRELFVNRDMNLGILGWNVATTGEGSFINTAGRVSLLAGKSNNSDAYIEQQITLSGTKPLELRVGCTPSKYAPMTIRVGTSQGGWQVYTVTTDQKDFHEVIDCGVLTSVWVQVRAEGGDNTTRRDVNFVTGREYDTSYYYGGFTTATNRFQHYYSNSEIQRLQLGVPPGSAIGYFTCPTQQPYEMIYYPISDTFLFQPVTFTGTPPAEWATGNYPGAQTFYQGRWWLGGTLNQPERFWGSESGNYYNFTVPASGAVASDPLEFNIDKKGAIKWMEGGKSLIVGADNAEFNMISEGLVLQTGDIQSITQSTYGSKRVQSQQVGNKIMYVSGDGRKVREMGYKWTDEGWISRDLTFLSEDITAGLESIRELLYARNPYDQVLCLTDNGNLIAATYERERDILGWYTFNTNDAVVHSIAVQELFGHSVQAVLVDRDVEATYSPAMFVQVFGRDFAFDSGWTQYNAVATDQLILPEQFLAGNLVSVKIDDAVYPDMSINTSGYTTMPASGVKFEIGYPYTAYMKSLPFTPDAQEGTSAPMYKRFNKIYTRVVASAKPVVNGSLAPVRHPTTPMGDPEGLHSEDVFVLNMGWDQLAQIEITQALPYSTLVAGIFGEEATESL